jgi:hypothetical protein
MSALGTSADRSTAITQVLPLTVAVDQNAALVQHPIQQEGSIGLNSLEVSDIDPTASELPQTAGQLELSCGRLVGERHEEIEVRAGILIAPRHRAVEDRESHTALGSKRSAERPQQLPVIAQILGLTRSETNATRPDTPCSQRALSGRSAEGSFLCSKVCG